MANGIARFPKTGFGLDTTTGMIATTSGTNDIFGTVRLQGAGSKIVVAGESTAIFHDPVTNNGGVIEVFPGSTPIYLQGLTTMGAGSLLSIHLADPDDEPDTGHVEIAGVQRWPGTWKSNWRPGFTPSTGDSFQILTAAGGITGSLSLAAVPTLPVGLEWDLDINPNAVVLSVVGTGDYNSNGVVDAGDYVVWRNMVGQTGTGLAADGNGNGVVDGADYDFWRSRFGKVIGAGVGAVAAVPEPASWVLLVTGWFIASSRKRRTMSGPGKLDILCDRTDDGCAEARGTGGVLFERVSSTSIFRAHCTASSWRNNHDRRSFVSEFRAPLFRIRREGCLRQRTIAAASW